MAKEYTPKGKSVYLDSEEWLDVAFGLRLARSIELSPKDLQCYDETSRKMLDNLSGRYLRIAESIERQVHE